MPGAFAETPAPLQWGGHARVMMFNVVGDSHGIQNKLKLKKKNNGKKNYDQGIGFHVFSKGC